MLKISKLADYATVVMSFLAKNPEQRYSAAAVARETHIAVPTVSKLLKLLHEAGLLHSTRGTQGGYQLVRSPEQISIATIITVIDGTPAITECSQNGSRCVHDRVCALRSNWRFINQVVFEVLDSLTLVDMHKNLIGIRDERRAQLYKRMGE